jgi:hypothetical protein
VVKEGAIPVFKGRPAVVVLNGWTIYLSIHDSAYMMTLRTWKQRLARAHPDKGGTSTKFREVYQKKRAWQLEEALWYAQLGMLPPDGCRLAEAKVKQMRSRKALIAGARVGGPAPEL